MQPAANPAPAPAASARAEPPSERTRVRRLPERGAYERAAIEAILDEGLVCHLGFVADGQPFVIPTVYARLGDRLYLHGSPASRMLRSLAAGLPVCATVTLVDGLVLARSAFHHSMNYRSVVVLGVARPVDDAEERLAALRAIVEHLVPGRWPDVRRPDARELVRTAVLALPIDEASAKLRSGGPKDDEEDLALDVWAGHVPLELAAGAPVPCPAARAELAPPAYATAWRRPPREGD
jgi:nitroimidazol reductase NimA-like FMN-containing flavoprotein (pyridoxamine 5'-phosphate oxidase superfamily)